MPKIDNKCSINVVRIIKTVGDELVNTIKTDEVTFEVFEFVEFQVGKSNFGISIQHVREIIQPVPVTVLPHAHPYIEGIIQLRGEVLPVIDLKKVNRKYRFN